MRKPLVLIFILLVGLAFPHGVLALEAGGKVEMLWSGISLSDGEFESELTESVNLELFLPPLGESELRYEFLVTKPVQGLLSGEKAHYFTKKLYLKHRTEHFHLTLGRQPISWSFGSLINPVDYTLGAVALDKESSSKYTDALEVYIPLDWNSGVDLVASFPQGFAADGDEMKWGIRGRTGIRGYDLTMNYVGEAKVGKAQGALDYFASFLPRQRVGLTAKGDVGDLGVYGALGYYFDEGRESDRAYLVGADYSYNLDYNTKITMQLEYLGLDLRSLNPSQRAEFLKMDGRDERLDMLVGRVGCPIDDFSQVSLLTMVNLDDGSLIVSPSYQNTLPGNMDLNIGYSAFWGKEDALFGSTLMPRSVMSVGLSYAF